ncbi:MAG: phytanoyl-CoA dioxygenase family protein [Verrucomicrobiia bacterium]|jgi:ectoine hydroxylase-related dioxygenase (phytanoyl-CoA dioxygenase family)
MTALSPNQFAELDDIGSVVLKDSIDADFLAELRRQTEEQFEAEGDQAGGEFKQEEGCRRLANLVDKGEIFQRVIAEPRTLEAVTRVLGADFKLSSLNARSVNPCAAVTQPLHADMAAIADERGYWVCNVIWMLDDLTPENGAPRIVPASHKFGRLPQDALQDPLAPHSDEILVTGKAGDVAVMNAHAWHGGMPNHTDNPRTALHAFYCRGDKPQQQYQKQLLSPETQSDLSPTLRRLLALDDPRNDELSTKVQVRSGFLK